LTATERQPPDNPMNFQSKKGVRMSQAPAFVFPGISRTASGLLRLGRKARALLRDGVRKWRVGIEAAPSVEGQSAGKPEAPVIERTIGQEVAEICFTDGRFPEQWPRHGECPACAGKDIVDAFAKAGFAHRRCRDCEFVFVDPFPPDDVAERLYAGEYYTNYREFHELPGLIRDGAATKFTAPDSALERVISRATGERKEGAWLDVGGGLGAFADLVKRRRSGWAVTLNELNPRSVEIAKAHFGVDNEPTSPAALFETGKRFDVISAISIVEHIPEPSQFVHAYARLLKPGGVLAICVPQFTALNRTVSRASSANVAPPFHVSFFDVHNFEIMLRRTQLFDRIEITQDGGPAFSLLHLVDSSTYWDITIPTRERPDPRSVMTKPYDLETAAVLNALGEAEQKIGDYFGDRDGRLYVTALAWIR